MLSFWVWKKKALENFGLSEKDEKQPTHHTIRSFDEGPDTPTTTFGHQQSNFPPAVFIIAKMTFQAGECGGNAHLIDPILSRYRTGN